ncbi:MAG: alpha/beta fold hydrolase [Ilumatobacteraceae bacterium]
MAYVRAGDGIRLHYSESGRRSGPPVLMIQGLGADKHLWDLQRLALAPHYRTIALDNRGAGRSDRPFGGYSLEQMADDAIAVLDHAGVETAHVVGASMGGVIAQILAIERPDRVRSMTLACTACRHHPWRMELLEEWAEIARTDGMGAMTKAAARWMIGPRSFRRISPAIGWFGPLAFARPAHAFIGQVEAILDIDDAMADRLGEITTPTLVMVGNQDILTPRGDSELLADLIPTAELVVVSGAAHGFMVEHASTFNSTLLEFLGRVEAARRPIDRTTDRSVGAARDRTG